MVKELALTRLQVKKLICNCAVRTVDNGDHLQGLFDAAGEVMTFLDQERFHSALKEYLQSVTSIEDEYAASIKGAKSLAQSKMEAANATLLEAIYKE